MDNKNKPRKIIGNKRPSQKNTKSDENFSDKITYKGNKKKPQNYYNSLNSDYANSRNAQRRRRIAEERRKAQIENRRRDDREYKPRESRSERVRAVPERRRPVEPERPKKTNHFKWKKPVIILVSIVILLFVSVIAYAKLAPINSDLSGDLEAYSISREAAAVAASHRIANVAIFGVDGREDVEGERSDAIMIGSADFEHNQLKVTSLMRDTFVKIADTGEFDKLNAAYSLGGPMGALKTINLNFDTAITDYIVFDFTALVAMVNAVGGVDINISNEEELYWINQYLMDVNDKVKTADPDVPGIGPQHLTGSQALAYARIRYTGNGDYDRTQRQRNVLEQVVAKVSAMSPLKQVAILREVLPYIQTTLGPKEFINYGLNFILMSDRSIVQDRLPQDGMAQDGYLGGVSYIFPDTLDDNIVAWYRFVYDINYTPSAAANEISEEITEIW